MSAHISIHTLRQMKSKGERFACLTAYDATHAEVISRSGVECILVGDSLGMVVQGHDSTLPVSLADMAYHTACVARGNQGSLLIADMPFLSYADTADAIKGAKALMQAGAHMVKLEGGAWLAPLIHTLRQHGVPACLHLGLTPQSVNVFGGYRVQGRGDAAGQRLVQDVQELEASGAELIVLECVPQQLAATVTQATSVPVIGIGAGPATDGQVLVLYDMLGLNVGKTPRFIKNFLSEGRSIAQACQAFAEDVRSGRFPASEHCFD